MRDGARAPAGGGLAAALAARIAGLSGWRRLLAAILAGAVLTAGQAPVSLPGLWFLAVPVIVWLTDGTARPLQAAVVGWGAAFGMFVTGLFWIGHAFLVDADQFAWLLPFAVTLLPAGLGLFWAVAFWLARRLWPAGSLWRVALLAALITLAEYARSTVLTGLPWGLAAYVWVETPVAQAASVIGPHGLSLVTWASAALPLVAVASARRVSRAGAAAAALAAVAIPALWIAGSLRLPEAVDATGPVLRIVQPNAAQTLKWNPDYHALFWSRLIDATAAPADPALGPPAAVIWPETAVPFLPAERPEERAEIAAAAGGVPVIVGALYREPRGGTYRWSNAMMAVMPDGSVAHRYDKHHLVPFGEYMPFREVFALLGIRQLATRGGFVPGPGPRVLGVGDLPPFSALICYEAIFPDGVLPEGPRPAWFLQVTNDAWFGSWGGPQQHLAQARFRAIEQGLPFVRSANTGISAVIDPYGRIVASLSLGETGFLDAPLPAPIRATIYAATGDTIALALAVLLLFAANLRQSRHRVA